MEKSKLNNEHQDSGFREIVDLVKEVTNYDKDPRHMADRWSSDIRGLTLTDNMARLTRTSTSVNAKAIYDSESGLAILVPTGNIVDRFNGKAFGFWVRQVEPSEKHPSEGSVIEDFTIHGGIVTMPRHKGELWLPFEEIMKSQEPLNDITKDYGRDLQYSFIWRALEDSRDAVNEQFFHTPH